MMKDDTQLAKWLNGETDDNDLKQSVSAEEFDTYSKIKKYSAQLTAPSADIDLLYKNITAKRNSKNKVVRLNPWYIKIAAMLVIALSVGYFYYTGTATTQLADRGQTKEFLLPDNSEVVLNAASSAKFKTYNWDNNREVTLDGEAYFKVAKGKKFDVTTNLGTVTVVGTQFNVKARNKRLDVTCFEGKVKVVYNNYTVLLTPGKSASFEEGNAIPIPDAKALQPGWTANEITFVSEKFENAIDEIERMYNVTIEVNTKYPFKPLNTTIPTNDLTTALDQITFPYNLKYVKSGNKIILSRG